MCHARYGASAAWVEEEWASEIASTIPPVAIAPWRWPPGGTRFFAGRGVFMSVCGNGESDGERWCSVWIGTKTEHPLQFLRPYVDDGWDVAF
jgi:hypothetical protein